MRALRAAGYAERNNKLCIHKQGWVFLSEASAHLLGITSRETHGDLQESLPLTVRFLCAPPSLLLASLHKGKTDKVFNHLGRNTNQRQIEIAHLEKELVVAIFKCIEAAVRRGPVLDALLKCIHLIRTAWVKDARENANYVLFNIFFRSEHRPGERRKKKAGLLEAFCRG